MRQDASMATLNGLSQEYPGATAARSLLRSILERYGRRDFAVELWDGERWPAESGNRPRFELVLRTPSVVRGLFSRPDSLSFGEAFVFNFSPVSEKLSAPRKPRVLKSVTSRVYANIIR